MDTVKVSVIGAGITGLTVADRLSAFPVEVTLIDRNPYPGGRSVFYGCKAVESCVRCGVCLVRDAMKNLGANGKINLLLASSPRLVRRNSDGGFRITVDTAPNPIDPMLCTSCGLCREVCPQDAVTAVPGWKYTIDSRCDGCGKCADVCPASAINLQREANRQTLDADYLVVASGFEPFDPSVNRKWGYGNNPRVIHGTDLEHLFFDEQYLPPDIVPPGGRMAFIQCVGSRSIMEGERGCSRVCCAYGLRMAGRLKEQFPELEIDFYYMDIQHFGKNFPSFWDGVRGKINFIRSNPISVATGPDGRPIVRCESPDQAGCLETSYDLVSLSHGIGPGEDAADLADMIGLDQDDDGFFRDVDGGIFVAGACRRPMRIDDSLEDGETVSARILEMARNRIE